MIDRLLKDARVALIPVRDAACNAPFVTLNARKAVELGLFQANRRPETAVHSAHLLRGLIAEKDGVAARLLRLSHVSAQDVRSRLDEIESHNPVVSEADDSAAISAAAAKVAAQAGAPSIGTDHLLAAILQDTELVAVHLLRDLSVDVDGLRQRLIALEASPSQSGTLSTLVPLAKQKGFERFSDSLLSALVEAQREAQRLGRNELDSQFLLYGLTQIRSGKAVELLRKTGISTFDLQFETEYLTGSGNDVESAALQFSPGSLTVFEDAFKAVRSMGHEMITPDVLMLALLGDDGPAATVLKSFNINIDRLRSAAFLSTGLRPECFGLTLPEKFEEESSERGKTGNSSEDSKVSLPYALTDEDIDEMFNQIDPNVRFRNRFDAGIIDAVRVATIVANSLGQTAVGTEHLLLGICSEGNCIAARLLTESGITISAIRNLIASQAFSPVYNDAVSLPFTDNAKLLLGRAFELAQTFASTTVTCNVLFMAMLGSVGTMSRERVLEHINAVRILEHLGVNRRDMRDRMLRIFNVADKVEKQAKAKLASAEEFEKLKRPKPQEEQKAAVPKEHYEQEQTSDHLDNFNAAALRVLLKAQEEASRMHTVAGSEHILLGLIQDTVSPCGRMLRQAGLRYEEVRTLIQQLLNGGDSLRSAQVGHARTARASRIIDTARQSAYLLKSAEVSPEHLLMGVLSEPGSVAEIVLKRYGYCVDERASRSIMMFWPVNMEALKHESSHGYSSGVRAQVFEVIVKQALADAPWKEICAAPMTVNNITVEEVEAELQRRRPKPVTEPLPVIENSAPAITNSAEAAMQAAMHEAKRMGNAFVSSEHVLLGLLQVDGLANEILRAFPVVPQKVRVKVLQILKTDLVVKEDIEEEDIAYTLRTEQILDLAWRYAREDAGKLGTGHLLLGLLGEGRGVAVRALHELAIDTNALARIVNDRLSAGENDSE